MRRLLTRRNTHNPKNVGLPFYEPHLLRCFLMYAKTLYSFASVDVECGWPHVSSSLVEEAQP